MSIVLLRIDGNFNIQDIEYTKRDVSKVFWWHSFLDDWSEQNKPNGSKECLEVFLNHSSSLKKKSLGSKETIWQRLLLLTSLLQKGIRIQGQIRQISALINNPSQASISSCVQRQFFISIHGISLFLVRTTFTVHTHKNIWSNITGSAHRNWSFSRKRKKK